MSRTSRILRAMRLNGLFCVLRKGEVEVKVSEKGNSETMKPMQYLMTILEFGHDVRAYRSFALRA